MRQVVDSASGARSLSVDQATDRSTPPRSSQWAVEKPWCQRHLPRRRKPQGCDPLPDTEWCRNSGRNEIESGGRCRRHARRSSTPHQAGTALSEKLRRNGKRYRCGAGTPDRAQVHPIRFTHGNYSKRAAVALPGSIHRHPPFSVVVAVWPIPSAAVEPLRTEMQRLSLHPRRVESGRALGHHETTLMKRSFNSR